MIRLVQRKLIIPRGDSGSFAIPPIASSEDAIAVFAILDPSTNKKVFSKIIEDVAETINVSLTHDETVNLPCGKFLWDIKYYTEPIIVDGELIGGTEVDSYYAAYTMPECEVRQTADNLLTADGSPETTLTPDAIDAITAALNEIDSKMAEIEEMSGHAPIIQNGEWYIWDTDTGAYIDSGVSATGPEGPQGETGPTGETGAPGPKGDPGEGVPTGGAEGDVLTKSAAADYATEWAAPAVTAAQFAALQAQIDALYPTKSVGPAAVVAIDDALAGNAQGLTVAIEPVQDGSGDPSPDNVRSITGWTRAKVTRMGKNLLDTSNIQMASWNKWDIPNKLKPNTTYTFSVFDATYSYGLFMSVNHTATGDGSTIRLAGYIQNTHYTFTTPSDTEDYPWLILGGNVNGAGRAYANFQLELGSTATDYEPYAGQTYDITFPSSAGTVYGGTLDVTNGVLTVTHHFATYDGSENWGTGSNYFVLWNQPNSKGNNDLSQSANWLVGGGSSSYAHYGYYRAQANGAVCVGNTNSPWEDATAFKDALSSNPLQVCYELATPQTYQLTPQQIALLRGNNTVWADTGDTTLTYKQDIALLLSKLDSTT